MLRFLGFLFTVGFILFAVAAGGAGYLIWRISDELPDYSQLAQYEPPVTTRVHAADGTLIAEYARERRLYVPESAIPKLVTEAFLAAEDKNFYQHSGVDPLGIARAVLTNAENYISGGGHMIGASTITQQVAKNFLLTNERTFDRKLKEALLSLRIEQAFSKDKILELYLNEIYLGFGAYGVAAASLNYFGKSLNDLSLAEVAYLAALPKAPNNYHPIRAKERATERRNWVLGQMAENGFVTREEAEAAMKVPLTITPREVGAELVSAEYFTEDVRREVLELYGEKKLYDGGLSIRTTLQPKLQIFARQALARGLLKYDRARGFRGPLQTIDISGDWGKTLSGITMPADLAPWQLAVVLETTNAEARIGLTPKRVVGGALADEREQGTISLKALTWARAAKDGGGLGPQVKAVSQVLKAGDVIYVAPADDGGTFHLVQVPAVSGGLVAMDPHTGRVLAMVGGFSYGLSQFNRASQAQRQPGSSFKPFVYAAALDNGYTPSSVILDAPIEVRLSNGDVWSPKNYSNKFYGPSTLRRGIELSRNVMTVRLVQDMGLEKVSEIAERFGIYDKMPPVLSMALGAGETTLMRMTTAFSMLDNGGKRIQPSLIDRVQDRYGHTIYRHDARDCPSCGVDQWQGQAEPEIADQREEILNPYTAYQITSMMEGVVQRGTGRAAAAVGKPLAGKSGTTNDEKDAWFIGSAPDLTVGIYVGYDNPKPMGKGSTGGEIAAPIFADFMKLALKDKPGIPFRVPSGVQLIPINPTNGQRAAYGDPKVILEAFKPGEGPADDTVVIGGGAVAQGVAGEQLQQLEGGLSTGTGGLY
ncbi:penicillin-binding protein 1A [Rhodoligotrophos appendicifer]|uniref:penicillin-binding protein 1A n=1 Tax=Rhodoligotrophos appendicifer TaxID=987056 RepID=UPI001185C743|nr:penicillin-binding protein 1A [Rhodoligotrophos appendicifer]